jgi:hypothetical protein
MEISSLVFNAYAEVRLEGEEYWFSFQKCNNDQTINTVNNPGFENGQGCKDGEANCKSNDASLISPWFISSPYTKFELFGSSAPNGGKWALDLNSDQRYIVAQIVNTTPGRKYQIEFDYSANVACSEETLDKQGFVQWVSFANQAQLGDKPYLTSLHNETKWYNSNSEVFTAGAKDANWRHFNSRAYDATVMQTLVEIGSITNGNCGPIIDNVQVHLID